MVFIHKKDKNNNPYVIYPSSSKWTSSQFIQWGQAYQTQDGVLIMVSPYVTGNCHIEFGEILNEDWISNHMECVGLIDINGVDLPNKEVSCSDGKSTELAPDKICVVKKDTKYLTDVYPIVFHDSIVEPASNAAAYIMKN